MNHRQCSNGCSKLVGTGIFILLVSIMNTCVRFGTILLSVDDSNNKEWIINTTRARREHEKQGPLSLSSSSWLSLFSPPTLSSTPPLSMQDTHGSGSSKSNSDDSNTVVTGSVSTFCDYCLVKENKSCLEEAQGFASRYTNGNITQAKFALFNQNDGMNLCKETYQMFNVAVTKPKGSSSISTQGKYLFQNNPLRCQEIRGLNGHWVQDWEYAKRARYSFGSLRQKETLAEQFFVPSAETPTRWAQSFKWIDDGPSRACPIIPIHYSDKDNDSKPYDNKNKIHDHYPMAFTSDSAEHEDNKSLDKPNNALKNLCHVCYQLNITKMLFMGDSLTRMATMGFRAMLGYPPIIKSRPQFFQPFKIPCYENKFEISILYSKGSAIGDWRSLHTGGKTNPHGPVKWYKFIYDQNDKSPEIFDMRYYHNNNNNTKNITKSSYDTMKAMKQNPPTLDTLSSIPNGRTVILANIGSWDSVRAMSSFQRAFKHWTDWLDKLLKLNAEGDEIVKLRDHEWKQNQVIAFYRSTSVGHNPCIPDEKNETNNNNDPKTYNYSSTNLQIKPFDSYNEFQSNFTPIYGWEMFEQHNQYAYEQILECQKELMMTMTATSSNNHYDTSTTANVTKEEGSSSSSSIKKKMMIHYLNVFNMTALRKDGHCGFGDCLHYNLPGPTDWWIHSLYSALLEMSSAEKRNTVI